MATEGKKETIDRHLEDVPDTSAVEAVVRDIETATDAKAELTAEQVIPALRPEVQEVGVTAIHEPQPKMISGSEFHAERIDGSGVTFSSTKKALETQIIEARSMAAKGPADNELKWGKLARFIAGARKRFQHPQIETLPDNVTPIKSFGNTQQKEQIAGPTLITSVEQKLPKAA